MNHIYEENDYLLEYGSSNQNPQETLKNSEKTINRKQITLKQEQRDSSIHFQKLENNQNNNNYLKEQQNHQIAKQLHPSDKSRSAPKAIKISPRVEKNSSELKVINQSKSLKRSGHDQQQEPNSVQQQQNSQSYKQNHPQYTQPPKSNNFSSQIQNYRLNQSYFTKQQLFEQPGYSQIITPSSFSNQVPSTNLLTDNKISEKVQTQTNQNNTTTKYWGGIQNNMRHGWGILITPKFIYQGHFSLDNKNGKGYIHYLENQSKYHGDFSNNKPNGHGLLEYGQQYYMGDFQNGSMNGDGLWKNSKGQKYIGKWKSNKAHGYGIYVTEKSHFQGQFNNFDKHGYGIETFNNGDLYKGDYVRGKPHGYGEYLWKSGITYKGNFVDGLRQGEGQWSNEIGDQYIGHFSVDHKNGYGEYKWANGNTYKGEFCQDMREGYGEMIWNDGSVYEGEWKRGLPNGKGTFRVKGQKTKHGIFEDNVLVEQMPLEYRRTNNNNAISRANRKSTHTSQDQKGYQFEKSKLYVNMPHPQPELLKRRRTGASSQNTQNINKISQRRGTKSLYKTTGSTMISNMNSRINYGSRRPSNSFRFN